MTVRKLSLVLLASLSASVALADDDDSPRGSIVIDGHGSASAAPEYARVSVVVTSLCYDSARAAVDANAALANRVVTLLQTYAVGEHDRVTASGGPTLLQTETLYLPGAAAQVLCERKWRTTNTLTIELATLARIPDVQDAIVGAVDSAMAVDPHRTMQTYADLSAPSFLVTSATQARLQREANVKAYQDAKSQFDAFAGQCAFEDVHLTTVAPPHYDVRPIASEQEAPADGQTPILPDELRVTATWRFKWTFTAPASCPAR